MFKIRLSGKQSHGYLAANKALPAGNHNDLTLAPAPSTDKHMGLKGKTQNKTPNKSRTGYSMIPATAECRGITRGVGNSR